MCRYRLIGLIMGGVWACTLAGCSPREEPRRYKAPKEEVPESVHDFGAMASVAPPTGGRAGLEYDVPESWAPGEVAGIRKAAFVVQDGERKVEITAIDLAPRAGELLPSVNLWRRQIQLGEITQTELDKAIVPIRVAGVEGHYVELVGPEDAEPRLAILGVVAIHDGRAWFFKLLGDAELALREKERFQDFVKSVRFLAPQHHGSPPVLAAAGGGNSPLEYDVPDGWTPGRVGGMRRAAFVVQDGERRVEITAIDLAASAGALLPNVNRWRRRIQLSEITQTELDKAIIPIRVAGVEGDYVELVGPEDAERRLAILGVIAIHDGRAWFFNMAGDADLALREKERFEGFVRSVKFATAGGAKNAD